VAHDDWLPSRLQLARYQRNPVKQALDKLRAINVIPLALGGDARRGDRAPAADERRSRCHTCLAA
jgi:hypothetical protein